MRQAYFTKSRQAKADFILNFAASARGSVVYVYPKNRAKEAVQLPRAYAVAYEDITKRDQWLHVNSIVDENSTLILENPSRYPKITSEKFRHLYRLAMHVHNKAIVDIVPFTRDVQYLYTPYCYLGRDILGYAHYYAFRENYYEEDEQGAVHSAHDFDVLARKIAPVSQIDYDRFLCRDRQTIEFESTPDEHAAYADRKAALFAKEKSPQRIVTRLADTAHAFQSRADALLELLSGLRGDTLVYTNLGTYAQRARRAIKAAGLKHVWCTSYQTGSHRQVANLVYLESPIVKSYYLLDAESRQAPDCRVFHLLGDMKVDRYLYGELDHELRQIDGLTRELWKEKHRDRETRPEFVQAVFAEIRP